MQLIKNANNDTSQLLNSIRIAKLKEGCSYILSFPDLQIAYEINVIKGERWHEDQKFLKVNDSTLFKRNLYSPNVLRFTKLEVTDSP
jgi:hypothetical protein